MLVLLVAAAKIFPTKVFTMTQPTCLVLVHCSLTPTCLPSFVNVLSTSTFEVDLLQTNIPREIETS
jgi:hypothetical protein